MVPDEDIGTCRSRSELRPVRALAHPAWWFAVLVLLVNDHVLKGAGLLPGWLTGKLSDVAGLFATPALFATLVCARSRRSVAICHALVGGTFAVLEVVPQADALWSAALRVAWVPWQTWADPTDLLALPALALSYR